MKAAQQCSGSSSALVEEGIQGEVVRTMDSVKDSTGMGVQMGPGAIALTRMPFLEIRSFASAFVNVTIAPCTRRRTDESALIQMTLG
jgi:hypothetical protein